MIITVDSTLHSWLASLADLWSRLSTQTFGPQIHFLVSESKRHPFLVSVVHIHLSVGLQADHSEPQTALQQSGWGNDKDDTCSVKILSLAHGYHISISHMDLPRYYNQRHCCRNTSNQEQPLQGSWESSNHKFSKHLKGDWWILCLIHPGDRFLSWSHNLTLTTANHSYLLSASGVLQFVRLEQQQEHITWDLVHHPKLPVQQDHNLISGALLSFGSQGTHPLLQVLGRSVLMGWKGWTVRDGCIYTKAKAGGANPMYIQGLYKV